MGTDESRAGVSLTNLDGPLFDGSGATKRDLVDYLDAVADRIIPVLADRPLSVIRVRPGQAPFMQKNTSRNAAEFAELFSGHPWVRVPRLVPDLCTSRVLTTEWVEGLSFDQFRATASPEVRQQSS